jgi:hypothetical protein
VVHHDVLGLAGGVAVNHADNADRLAFDLSRVVLDEVVVAVGAGVVDLLVLVQRFDCQDD